jgi:hypothetical protein
VTSVSPSPPLTHSLTRVPPKTTPNRLLTHSLPHARATNNNTQQVAQATSSLPEDSKLLDRKLGRSVRKGQLGSQRALAAARWVDKEIRKLIALIIMNGTRSKDGVWSVSRVRARVCGWIWVWVRVGRCGCGCAGGCGCDCGCGCGLVSE